MYEVVQFELVDLASIESREPVAHMIEQSAQFLLVVGSDNRASSLPRGLVYARTVTRPRLTHEPTVRFGAELRRSSARRTKCRYLAARGAALRARLVLPKLSVDGVTFPA